MSFASYRRVQLPRYFSTPPYLSSTRILSFEETKLDSMLSFRSNPNDPICRSVALVQVVVSVCMVVRYRRTSSRTLLCKSLRHRKKILGRFSSVIKRNARKNHSGWLQPTRKRSRNRSFKPPLKTPVRRRAVTMMKSLRLGRNRRNNSSSSLFERLFCKIYGNLSNQ